MSARLPGGCGRPGPRWGPAARPPGRRGARARGLRGLVSQSVAVRLLLAPGECARLGAGTMRGSSEPPRAAGSSFCDCVGACGAVCVRVTVRACLPGGLSEHGVCWCLESRAVVLAFVAQASACASVQVPGRAWRRPCHCGRARPVCAPCLGASCSVTARACQSGCWGVWGCCCCVSVGECLCADGEVTGSPRRPCQGCSEGFGMGGGGEGRWLACSWLPLWDFHVPGAVYETAGGVCRAKVGP